MPLQITDFNYQLPQDLIANEPLKSRDTCKLLLLDREKQTINHRKFCDIADMLGENDVLVLNQSKVFPARLQGKKITGGNVELLLLREIEGGVWNAISKPGLKVGIEINFGGMQGRVVKREVDNGQVHIKFDKSGLDFLETIEKIGLIPIPPYIHTNCDNQELKEEYQTVYAKQVGSAAAPTAGLHFTQELLDRLKNKKVGIEFITLHVGLGTFQSLRQENILSNSLHLEYYEIEREVAERLNQAKLQGKRIITVGTTSTRALESAVVSMNGKDLIQSINGSTRLFINPPYKFKFVDSLITNFHLPESSLLMLVAAFVSSPNTSHDFVSFNESSVGKSYCEAILQKYRFYSFGDAMWIF